MMPFSDWLIGRLNSIGLARQQIEIPFKAKKLYKENRLKRLYDPIHRAQKSNNVILTKNLLRVVEIYIT